MTQASYLISVQAHSRPTGSQWKPVGTLVCSQTDTFCGMMSVGSAGDGAVGLKNIYSLLVITKETSVSLSLVYLVFLNFSTVAI